MQTQNSTLTYSDFINIHNSEINLTPENSCFVIFSNDRVFQTNTTDIMERFLADNKTYMVFNFGFCDDNDLYLVAKYESTKCAPISAPSISMIKSTASTAPSFSTHSRKLPMHVSDKCLQPLLQAIIDSLPLKSMPGLYTVQTENLPLIKAQLMCDRSGFRKIWIKGTLHDEKNYGFCSMVFSVVGIYLR